MEVNSFAKPLALVAGVLGIVQGTTWCILSLMAILIHMELWVPTFNVSWLIHREALNFVIVSFFVGDHKSFEVFLGPKQFFIWAFVYLGLSSAWVGISVDIFRARNGTNYRQLTKTYLTWAGCTIIICFCDLILSCLLLSDYYEYVRLFDMMNLSSRAIFVYAVIGCGILMTIAAKGLVLWMVNVIFAVLMWKQSRLFAKKVKTSGEGRKLEEPTLH